MSTEEIPDSGDISVEEIEYAEVCVHKRWLAYIYFHTN